MTIGGSLFLIAAGAILRFAVTDRISGVDLSTAGLILMIVGAIGALYGFYLASRTRVVDPVADPVVDRRRDVL